MAAEFEQDSSSLTPKFYFAVDFGPTSGLGEVRFQEVSGIDIDVEHIEYRAGNDPRFSLAKMPGLVKASNLRLKRGYFKNCVVFWEWFGRIKMNTIVRDIITIKLLDEVGKPSMTWELTNAWPTKIVCTEPQSEAEEITVESIEVVYEGINIVHGG